MSGYVDLQVNGYAGVDFNGDALTDEQFVAVCEQLRRDGVASLLPTVITDRLETMIARIERIATAAEQLPEVGELVAGIHVEGPFISPVTGFVGAHPADCVCNPTVAAAMRLLEAGRGKVRLLTLAPESPGACEVTRRLADENVIVAGGHSDASRDELQRAIDAGMSLFTHLGNGCPVQMHRHDNIVQRVLSLADQLTISFIADGHHVPWFALANYLRLIPEDRVVIVTDAISAAGLGPGEYHLAGQTVYVDDDLAAWGAERKQFAGCATTMPRMVELLSTELGIDPQRIERWTTHNPARVVSC